MSVEKTPVRVEIERQIIAALSQSVRPMTLRELMPDVDAAEGPQQVARILGYMRNDGEIVNGPDVQPGEPGGLSGKGARAVAYCLPRDGQAIESASTPIDADLVAALKMSVAEEDDGEACLDSDRRGYAEFSDTAFERDVLELRQIAEHAAIDAADALIRGSTVRAWESVQRLHRAVVGFAEDYA